MICVYAVKSAGYANWSISNGTMFIRSMCYWSDRRANFKCPGPDGNISSTLRMRLTPSLRSTGTAPHQSRPCLEIQTTPTVIFVPFSPPPLISLSRAIADHDVSFDIIADASFPFLLLFGKSFDGNARCQQLEFSELRSSEHRCLLNGGRKPSGGVSIVKQNNQIDVLEGFGKLSKSNDYKFNVYTYVKVVKIKKNFVFRKYLFC